MSLHIACGAIVAITTPFAGGMRHQAGAIAVGLLAVFAGLCLPAIDWTRRFGRGGELLIIPESLVLVVGFNLMADWSFVYSLFYVAVWIWIGLTQAPGTAIRFSPLLLIAYLTPAFFLSSSNDVLLSTAYVVPVAVAYGEVISFVAEKHRASKRRLAESEARFAGLLRHSSEYVLILDEQGRIAFASESVRSILGCAPESLLGRPAGTLVHPSDGDGLADWYRSVRQGGVAGAMELRVRHDDGSWRWIETRVEDLTDDPVIGGVVCNCRDISDRREVEDDLEWTAYTDELTGLPNRPALLNRLGTLVDLHKPIVVLLLDLDRFKRINDSLGHPIGDTLLQAVTVRLSSVTSGLEHFRLGGDEFIAVGQNLDLAPQWAEQIVRGFAQPFEFDGRRFQLTASVGVVTSDDHPTVSGLLQTADLAMYTAKRRGGDQWSRFDADMAYEAQRRLDIENDLRMALANDELIVHFLPEVDAETDRVVGAEALVRWLHPSRSWIEPDEFLPIAEETGLIDRVGHIVIGRALDAARMCADAGAEVQVSVNMSARQLRDPGIADFIRCSLELWDLPGDRLRIEVTESALLEPEVHDGTLPALRDLGVAIAVDRFGTGHSSLTTLHELTIDALKIDRSFLPEVGPVPEPVPPLLAAVVAMAHSLQLTVVAEGVETEAQCQLLRQLGCTNIQGHLVSPAVPARSLVSFVERRTSAPAD